MVRHALLGRCVKKMWSALARLRCLVATGCKRMQSSANIVAYPVPCYFCPAIVPIAQLPSTWNTRAHQALLCCCVAEFTLRHLTF